MKVLQQRVCEFEAFNTSLAKETSQAKKDLNIKEMEVEMMKKEIDYLQKTVSEI